MLPCVRLCMRSIVAGSDTCGRIGVRQAMQDTQAHNLACKAQLTARYSAAHCSSKEPSIPKQRKTEPSQNFRVYKATRVLALQSKPRHQRCSPMPTEQMVTDRCLSSSSMAERSRAQTAFCTVAQQNLTMKQGKHSQRLAAGVKGSLHTSPSR
jgi:hypothetical protein